MLKPAMKELLDKVGNRYLLVNLAAQRARDLAQNIEQEDEFYDEKPVKLALEDIASGKINMVETPEDDIEEDMSFDESDVFDEE